MLGPVPYLNAEQAWKQILTYFPEIPAWPQLSHRSYLEEKYSQFSERFPGIVQEGRRLYVHRERKLEEAMDRLYLAYLRGDLEHGAIRADHAQGLSYLINERVPFMQPPEALKGQITGPISYGLAIADQNRRPIIYDDLLAEALAHHLYLKAAWQEAQLKRFAEQTIIFVDEPYLSSFDSAVAAISRSDLLDLLDGVLSGISGLKGIHCSGRADWSLLLETSLDILSVNVFAFAQDLASHAQALHGFLERGGIIAWGIVPSGPRAATETVESLVAHLHKTIDLLVDHGIPREQLLSGGLITCSQHVADLSIELAERVFYLCAGVSSAMQTRYTK